MNTAALQQVQLETKITKAMQNRQEITVLSLPKLSDCAYGMVQKALKYGPEISKKNHVNPFTADPIKALHFAILL